MRVIEAESIYNSRARSAAVVYLPLASISTDEIDRILGCVLEYSDSTFDQALMLGFASAIRKERAWRIKRGESLANLQAFARLADGS